MEIIKKYKSYFIFILVVLAGAYFFFFRMYQADIKALREFMASYESFDKVTDIHTDGGRFDALGKAGQAVIELQAKASLRLSSLIKNDAELMDLAREVADLSRRELDSLKAYDAVPKSQNPDPDEVAKKDELAKEYGVLCGKRKAAYARFRELGGKGSDR